MMSLTADKLDILMDSGKLFERDKAAVSILLTAINDWPEPIATLAQYVAEVERFAGGHTGKSILSQKITSSTAHRESWKQESLAVVLEIFIYLPDMSSLKEVVEYLDEKYLV